MKALSWLGLACVAALATGCATTPFGGGTTATDFNGDWQIVQSRSDAGRTWLDDRNRLGVEDREANQRTRYRAWFLPDEFRIEGSRSSMRIEDEGGALIAEVPFEGDYRESGRGLRARWIGDDRFEVERVGAYRRMRQTFSLEDRGERLVVETEVERDGGTRSYTRVYDRT